jgi:hypothetical protein
MVRHSNAFVSARMVVACILNSHRDRGTCSNGKIIAGKVVEGRELTEIERKLKMISAPLEARRSEIQARLGPDSRKPRGIGHRGFVSLGAGAGFGRYLTLNFLA